MDEKVKNMVMKAASNWNSSSTEDGQLVIVDVKLVDGRTQIVLCVETEETGTTSDKFLRFASPVGRFIDLNPEKVLGANAYFSEGSFAKMDFDLQDGLGDSPCLVAVVNQRISTATVEELTNKIKGLAEMADSAEEQIFGTDRT